MKIRELYIENYKMFRDFKIDFVDSDDKPLDIVVLAGVNGSGKTTLLEYMSSPKILKLNSITIHNTRNPNGIELFEEYDESDIIEEKLRLNSIQEVNDYIKNIIYIPIDQNNIKDLKDTIRQKYIDRAFEIDKPSKALEELQTFISDIFKGLDLTFNLSSIDYNKNLVRFQDNSGDEFDIDALSTGEKTLLSKLLYLYFKDYNDKVILIDEPELSLHPSWQNRVLKIYENFAKLNNCQIIIATHSPNILINTDSESLRFLVKEEGKIIAKKLSGSPLDRDLNTFLKTLMGTDYMPKELEELHQEYRKLFDERKEDTNEGKELEKKILEWESPNSSFWQGLAFDRELRDL